MNEIRFNGTPLTNSIAFTVSREQALMWGMDDYTPEELAEHNAEMDAFHEQQRELRVRMLGLLADVRNMSSLGNAILDLHSCDIEAEWRAECDGCDFDGMESEPPEWPCRTVLAVAHHYGVQMPDRALPGKHYEGQFVPHDGKRWQLPRLTSFTDAMARTIDSTIFHGTDEESE